MLFSEVFSPILCYHVKCFQIYHFIIHIYTIWSPSTVSCRHKPVILGVRETELSNPAFSLFLIPRQLNNYKSFLVFLFQGCWKVLHGPGNKKGQRSRNRLGFMQRYICNTFHVRLVKFKKIHFIKGPESEEPETDNLIHRSLNL